MLYNTFLGMITPFINARGNSIMFPPQSIETTVNMSVQQIYNAYKWSWLFKEETLTMSELGDKYVGTTTYPIKYALGLEYTENDQRFELFPEHSVTELNDTTYNIIDKTIKVTENKDYTFTYLRDYDFLSYASNSSLEIPVPNKVIPALYYLVLSQLDLIDVQQLQGQPANNFNKYQYEIKNLMDNDMGYESQLIGANPQ